MSRKDTFIIDSVRTAIGNFGGSLSTIRTDDLAAHVIKSLINRYDFDFGAIDDVIIGCANQAGEDNRNIARMASLLAGLPYTVPGETINRLCASGMSAVIHAHRSIQAGDGDLFISGGVEHMTRGPWIISKTSKSFGRDAEMYDSSFGWRFINPMLDEVYGTDSMGQTAENLAEKYDINRLDQDAFAYRSQKKAYAAQTNGRFKKEIVAVNIPQHKSDSILFDADEFIRPQTTTEVLATLKPAFKKEGTVTAGNSSGLNDGTAAILIASEEGVSNHELTPMARIVASAVVGVEPRKMGIGPVQATNNALEKAGLKMDNIDIIEINEAFSVVTLAAMRELKIPHEKVNVFGGAVSLGHPIGASGARILVTLISALKQKKQKLGLATLCIGGGEAAAVVIEMV